MLEHGTWNKRPREQREQRVCVRKHCSVRPRPLRVLKRTREGRRERGERSLRDRWTMAALPSKDAALITGSKKRGINLQDPYCIKRVLDDATSEVCGSFLSVLSTPSWFCLVWTFGWENWAQVPHSACRSRNTFVSWSLFNELVHWSLYKQNRTRQWSKKVFKTLLLIPTLNVFYHVHEVQRTRQWSSKISVMSVFALHG